MKSRFKLRPGLVTLAVIAIACPSVYAAEHVTLRNGFEFDCIRRETTGDRVRLYLLPAAHAAAASQRPADQAAAGDNNDENYIEVSASAVLRVESIPDPAPTSVAVVPPATLLSSRGAAQGSASPDATPSALTPAEISQLLARAGTLHNIDTDLLASVVQAESGGNAFAVSRAGAQGLMQLMPETASELNVHDRFAPGENIGGGTAYLDALLTRYRDNIALALAAYNAGPAAVDRYHGIPPYAETRAYVARVIREFNRRKRSAPTQLAASK